MPKINKNVGKSLKISELRYRRLFETAQDGILLVDSDDGMIMDVNPFLIGMLGYTKADFLKKHLWEIGAFKNIIASKEKFLELKDKNRKSVRYEDQPLEAKDGRNVDVEFVSNAYKVDGTTVIQCNIRDITERKRLKEELLRSKEEKFKNIFDNARDGILLVDLKDKKLNMGNREFCRMLGYSQEELINLSVSDIHPEKDLAYVLKQFEKQEKRESHSALDIPVKRKDGSIFYADINSTPITIEEKKFLLGFFRDITERKKAENEILFKNTLLEAESEASLDGILVVNSAAHAILVNRRFGQMWGIPQQILDLKDDERMLDFVSKHLTDPNEFRNKVAYLYEHKEEKSHDEIRFIDGRIFDRYSAPLVSDRGNNYGRIWYFRDVTERRRMEEEKRAAAELKVSSEIKSKFTSMVSHELRSPLAAIKEGANMMMEGLAGNISGEQKDLLTIVKRNADRLGRLINNVLDFQKFQTGKMECDISVNDINEAVREAYATMHLLAKEKGLDSALDLDERIPKIKFDFDKIIQVITNLISNALKVTDKGSILVTTKLEGEAVHMMIRDTGPGIREVDIKKLFKPFEQLDVPKDRKRGGTGLGLAISKEIVLAHKGKIWAESDVGRGSVFHITLPIGK